MVSNLAGLGIALFLMLKKLITGGSIMAQHGPLMIFAAVLIIAGVQMLALGLLGELQVHHYYGSRAAPYSVDRVFRAKDPSAVAD